MCVHECVCMLVLVPRGTNGHMCEYFGLYSSLIEVISGVQAAEGNACKGEMMAYLLGQVESRKSAV